MPNHRKTPGASGHWLQVVPPLCVLPEGVLVGRDKGIGKRGGSAYVEPLAIGVGALPSGASGRPCEPGFGGLLLLQQAVGEDDLDDRCDGVLAGPVALQLDRERDPADRLPAGLDHAVKAGAVGLG